MSRELDQVTSAALNTIKNECIIRKISNLFDQVTPSLPEAAAPDNL